MQALQYFCGAPLEKASSASPYVRDRSSTVRYNCVRFHICKIYTKLQSNLFSVTMDWINPAWDRDRLTALVNAVISLRVPCHAGNFVIG
jgi:hypothetical protein